MATTLGRVTAAISLRAQGYQRGAGQVDESNRRMIRNARRLQRRMERVQRAFGGFIRTATRYATIGGGFAAGLTALVVRAGQAADSIAKISQSIGLAGETLQALQFEGQSFDLTIQQVNKSLTRFNSETSAVREGLYSEIATELEGLNPELLEIIRNSKDTEEALRAVFEVLRDAPESRGAALGDIFFGTRTGARFADFARRSGDIDAITANAQARGVIISQEALDNAQRFNQAVTNLTVRLQSTFADALFNTEDDIRRWEESLEELGNKAAPLIEAFADALAENVDKVPGALTALVTAVQATAEAINSIVSGSSFLGRVADNLGSAFAAPFRFLFERFFSDLRLEAIQALHQAQITSPIPTGLIDARYTIRVLENIEKNTRRTGEGGGGGGEQPDPFVGPRIPPEELAARQRARASEAARRRRFLEVRDAAVDQQRANIQEQLEESARRFQVSMEQAREASRGVADALGQGVRELIQGQGAARVLQNIMARVAEELLRVLLIQPLVDSLASGFTGFFSGLTTRSSGGQPLPSGLVDSGRQFGGPVSAGRRYLVGERGPELFEPYSSGRIIPGISSSGASPQVNIQVINQTRQPANAESRLDPVTGVVQVILTDAQNNGPITQTLNNQLNFVPAQ